VVDALLKRGHTVFSINPKQLDRFRDRFSVAGAKDDSRDALVLARSLRTDPDCFRPLRTDDPRLIRLRELSRAEESYQQDLRRAANQLWSLLQRYFPALLALCPAADEPWLWSLLEAVKALPSVAAKCSAQRLEAVLRQHRIRRFQASELVQAFRQPLPLAPGVAAALAEQVLLLLPRLRLLHQQLAQMAQRVETLLDEISHDDSFSEHRTVQILRSIPGVGRQATVAVLTEGSTPLAARDYHTLRALCGLAPVTQQSGNSKLVCMRRACNRRLRHALFHSANVYIQHDARARALYSRHRQKGQNHARALRSVGDRLLALILTLVRKQILYDPTLRLVASSTTSD
jgi:transposase